MSIQGADELAPDIVAALDEVLVPENCESAMMERLRKLIENCLKDNYDTSDVLAVIELVVENDNEAGSAREETGDGA